MLKVYMGIQSAKGTEATTFRKMKTTDASLDNQINEIVSQAITGKDFAEEGLASKGTITGTLTAEASRGDMGLLFTAEGFTKDDTGADLVFKAPEIATYPYLTVVQEFTDDSGVSIHKKFLDVKINDLNINLNTNSYVQVQITPLSESSGTIVSGAFSTTPTAETEESLVVKESLITIGGTDVKCDLTTLSIDINNNLSGVEVLCGDTKINKGGKRTINISESMPTLSATEYKAELAKAEAGTPQAILVTLGTTDNKKIEISIPKCTYSAISMGNLTGSGSSDRTLGARWDGTAGTAMVVTSKGLGTA